MSEDLAAQAEGEVIDDPRLDTPEVETEAEAITTESAPVTDEPKEAPQDGFQKRINKVTADKYAEKRRADDLQKRLDELAVKPVETQAQGSPKLEDFDFDQEKHNAALIKHEVAEGMKAQNAIAQQAYNDQQAQQAQGVFNERVATLGKEDFDTVASAVPTLPVGVADALVQSENGAELIYHLGTHLDLADKLAGMTPAMAMMELGKISLNMSAQPDVKLSAAPDPIEPLNSGGSVSQQRGPKGAIYE